jgi:hypothetical protein
MKKARDMMRLELDKAIENGLSERARERYINCTESYRGEYHDYAIEHGLDAAIKLLEADATPEDLLSGDDMRDIGYTGI